LKTLSIFPFEYADTKTIDSRLLPFTINWYAKEQYNGKTVNIPGTWNSKFTILNYFQVVKDSDDPNPGEDENEIGMTILGGWFPYDSEIIINLFIRGGDVLDGTNKISAEILKSGSAPITLYHNNKLVTNFTEKKCWWTIPKDKIWIEELT